MANETLTAEAVRNAVQLYESLPAATSFRGLTGYGLVVDQQDNEVVAPVGPSKGIWKSMYVEIRGGERRGRKTVTAAEINAAVEQFTTNPLWAVLRSTSGRGLRFNAATDTVKLVDVHEAATPISFEVTHYGGRSIVPLLTVKLGTLMVGEIEWQSGFFYGASSDRIVRFGEPLVLTRFLTGDDFTSEAAFARVWADIEREAARLTLLHTDGRLPKVHEDHGGRMRVTLSQELTALVLGAYLDEEQGFNYRVRGDKVVEVQMSLHRNDLQDEPSFTAALEAFRKECNRVSMLNCQPLTDNQKRLLGRPSSEVRGFVTTPQIEWQPSREDRTKMIGFHPTAKGGNAVFPADGWKPERGKTHRVYCCRKGRGFTGYPAPALYEERLVQKDQSTAVRQLVRIEFDGTERVVVDAEIIQLGEKQQMQESNYWSPRLELMEDGQWWIVQTCTPQWQTFREVVTDDYNRRDVNGNYAKKVEWRCVHTESCPAERRFHPDRMWVEINGYQGSNSPSEDDLARVDQARALYGFKLKARGIDQDGQEVEISLKPQKNQYYVLWEEIPLDHQMAFLIQRNVDWPLCSCMMRRRRSEQPFCSVCATHRNCQRCGKDEYFGESAIAKAETDGTKLYCGNCKKWMEAVAILDDRIPAAVREKVAAEAQKLLAGEMIEDEEQAGQVVAAAINRRYRSDYERHRVLRALDEVRFAVVTAEGDWATAYMRAELERFATMHEQPESELMLTVAMLTDRRVCAEYVRHPARVVEHSAQYVFSALQGGRVIRLDLAQFVAESEVVVEAVAQVVADAETALTQFRGEVHYLPDSDTRVQKLAEARRMLENRDLVKARECAEAVQQLIVADLAIIAAGGLVQFSRGFRLRGENDRRDVWVIDPLGNEVEAEIKYDRRTTVEGIKAWAVVSPDCFVGCWSRGQHGERFSESWEVVQLPKNDLTQDQTVKIREVEPHERFRGPATGFDLSQISSVSISVARNDLEVPLRVSLAGSGQPIRKEEPCLCEVYGWGDEVIPFDEKTDGWAFPAFDSRVATRRRELRDRLRRLQESSHGFERELEKCEGEDPTRVLLKFELDSGQGTLFAIINVTDLSVQEFRTERFSSVSGSVRFVCPKRCHWLDQQPAVNQTWVCSWGKMVGRDRRNRPVIVANPQVRVDQAAEAAIEAEIQKIEAELAGARSGTADDRREDAGRHSDASPAAEAAVEQIAADEKPQSVVTNDVLAALQAKFKG